MEPTEVSTFFALALCLLVVHASQTPLSPSAETSGDEVYSEDFRTADPETGLPPGWSRGPQAHVPFFSTYRSDDVFATSSPALAVELPLEPLNYRVASPRIPITSLDEELTLEFALRLEMPDATFFVECVAMAPDGTWLGRGQRLLVLGGEVMDQFRTYRVSFRPLAEERSGRLWIIFGLSYKKTMREGRFWLDDLLLERGRSAGELDVYVSPPSAAVGDPIALHISSGRDTVRYQVFREGAAAHPQTESEVLPACRLRPIPSNVWEEGCRWPAEVSIGTEGWNSGVYLLRADNGDQTEFVHFFLHGAPGDAPPEADEPVVIFPVFTGQAYNAWGGRSFYTSAVPALSFERPTNRPGFDFFDAPVFLVRWLERTGRRYHVATDFELHRGAEYLRRARTWVIPWHSEYWTREMRQETEAFIERGGSVLVLGGNVLWWQARLVAPEDPIEPGSVERLVCYKYEVDRDPYRTIDSTRVTTHWDDPPLRESAIETFGLSWRTGGMVNWSTASSCPCEYDWLDGHGGFTIVDPEHWIFRGTGLGQKDVLGQGAGIVGYEVDGVPHEWIRGLPVPARGTTCPPETKLLAHASAWNQYHPDNHGDAFIALRETDAGGVVFHAGTTGWCWGLARDPQVQQVTANLLERRPASVPPALAPTRLAAVPNPAKESVEFRWIGPPGPISVDVYSADGRWIRSLPLVPDGSGAAVTWDFRSASGSTLGRGPFFARSDGARVKVVRVR